MKKITDYEILDHGVDHSQYFQGCGVAYTEYDECVTGVGYSYKSALEDALDQLSDSCEFERIPSMIIKELENADDTDLVNELIKENLPPTEYNMCFVGHNGITWDSKHNDLDDARYDCAEWIRHMRRRGAVVTKLDTYKWEIETSSNRNGDAITDNDGILTLDIIEHEIPEDTELYYYVSIRIKTEE